MATLAQSHMLDPWSSKRPTDGVFLYYRRLKRVRHYVEEHYDREISLTQIAEIACMEKSSFSRFFSCKVGMTFTDWLTRVRVAKAMSLMERQNLRITDVAYAVGFSELRSFERAFKKVTHLTPLQFKKRVRPA